MKRIALLLCGTVFLSGCSILAPTTQRISVSASHPDADIIIEGENVGKGPVEYDFKRDRQYMLMAKIGDRVGKMGIKATAYSSTGKMDAFFGVFLFVPLIGLMFAGSKEFAIDSVSIPLPNVTVIEGGKYTNGDK